MFIAIIYTKQKLNTYKLINTLSTQSRIIIEQCIKRTKQIIFRAVWICVKVFFFSLRNSTCLQKDSVDSWICTFENVLIISPLFNYLKNSRLVDEIYWTWNAWLIFFCDFYSKYFFLRKMFSTIRPHKHLLFI